jgi:hypothetical protein
MWKKDGYSVGATVEWGDRKESEVIEYSKAYT